MILLLLMIYYAAVAPLGTNGLVGVGIGAAVGVGAGAICGGLAACCNVCT